MLRHPARGTQALAITAFLLSTGCASHERPRAAPEAEASAPAPQKTISPQHQARHDIEAGNELFKRGLYDEAEHQFRLALEADPGSLDAVAGLGRVAVQRGQYSEAVPLLERATRVSSQIVSAFQALGDAYAATGDVEKATAAYRQAVALAPEDLDARISLARSLTEIGEYSEAAEVCARSMRLARDDPGALARVHMAVGEVYSRQGNTPAAMSAYYKAAELNPRDVEVAPGLADCS